MPRRILSAALASLLLAAAPLYADGTEDAAAQAAEKLGGSVTRDDSDPAHPVVAVDLNAGHLAVAVLTPDGNQAGTRTPSACR